MNWISVEDRLPTKEECHRFHGWFLVKRRGMPKPELSRYDKYEREYCYEHAWKYAQDITITHWMPLPDLPKKE